MNIRLAVLGSCALCLLAACGTEGVIAFDAAPDVAVISAPTSTPTAAARTKAVTAAATTDPTVDRAEVLCADGVDYEVKVDMAWSREPVDENEAFEMLVDRRGALEPGDYERFRVTPREYPTWAWAGSQRGRVTQVIKVVEGKRSYVADGFLYCN